MHENKTLDDVLTQIAQNQVNAVSVVKDLTGEVPASVIRIENRPVAPVRSKSPARCHVFHDANGFVAYLEKNKSENMIVLADTDDRKVAAVLDDTAKTGFENIELRPAYHPQFKTLLSTLLSSAGQEVLITRFAKRVMMCKNIIVAADNLDAKGLAMLMQQITVSSKITACVGVGVSAMNGVMCQTDIKGGRGEATIELPESITVELPIFINTEAVNFDIEIVITTDGPENCPVVIAMAPQLEEKVAEVFEELLSPVKQIAGAVVSYGKPDTTPWKYIS